MSISVLSGGNLVPRVLSLLREVEKGPRERGWSDGTSPLQGANRPQPSAVSFLVAAREIKDGEEHWPCHIAQIFGRK